MRGVAVFARSPGLIPVPPVPGRPSETFFYRGNTPRQTPF